MTSIAYRLREERERLGYSQTAFGGLGGKSKQTVIQWEGGDQFPNAAFMSAIAAAGADVQYILTGRHGAPALTVEQERAGYAVEVLSPAEQRALDALRTSGVLGNSQSAVVTQSGADNVFNQSQGGENETRTGGRRARRPGGDG